MTTQFASERVRATIFAILSERGVTSISDTEPLFSTGRLDSLAAAEVLAQLEGDYGVDLASDDFDITRIDTLGELEKLVASTVSTATGGTSLSSAA